MPSHPSCDHQPKGQYHHTPDATAAGSISLLQHPLVHNFRIRHLAPLPTVPLPFSPAYYSSPQSSGPHQSTPTIRLSVDVVLLAISQSRLASQHPRLVAVTHLTASAIAQHWVLETVYPEYPVPLAIVRRTSVINAISDRTYIIPNFTIARNLTR